MNLLIVQPSHYLDRTRRAIHKTRRRSVISLTLPYLAALTPREWKVSLVDEQLSEIDFDSRPDLVAVSTWTINSFRAYHIADEFRKRGVPVVMGGPHTYFHAEEAAAHCEAVGIGEGEDIWPNILADAARGTLKRFYRAKDLETLENLPLPRYDLMNGGAYRFFKAHSVQTSRGCPFRCEFCSERFYVGNSYRYRPVADVIREIKESGAKNVLFADSNFAGKAGHTMELMEALIPLKLRWSTLWSAYLCNNETFLDLAKRSGLLHVNMGIESINVHTLAGMKKRANKVKQYKRILQNLRERGISFSLNFIFGWDTETKEVFHSTLQFLKDNKVPVAYFNILTPHKGTPLYERMKRENRIIDIENIGRWPDLICHIKPKHMSPQELEKSVRELYREFYNFPSMFSRLPLPFTSSSIVSWVVNMTQLKSCRANMFKENFDYY